MCSERFVNKNNSLFQFSLIDFGFGVSRDVSTEVSNITKVAEEKNSTISDGDIGTINALTRTTSNSTTTPVITNTTISTSTVPTRKN